MGGKWFLFGGKVEQGEHPYRAAQREFHEEMGIYRPKLDFSHRAPYLIQDRAQGMQHIFTFTTDKNMRKYRIGEGAGVSLFHVSELEHLSIAEWDKERLLTVLKEQGW